MPYYVVLNFEDANPNAGTGVLVGDKSAKPAGIGAAAVGTLGVYQKRAAAKSKIFNKKETVYYSCQELLALDRNHSLTKDYVEQIREDCNEAKTVAFVIHGTPTDTEHGFSTSGQAVCTWQEMGRLALLLLPNRGDPFNVALIMCYAARSEDAELDHRGEIPHEQLKTSFSYKFFRSICALRNVRMTARTGAVSSDGDVNHTVETEEQVFSVLEMQKITNLRKLNKAAMDIKKKQLLATGPLTAKQFEEMTFKFAQDPGLKPANDTEAFAKDYVVYSPYVKEFVNTMYGKSNLGNRDKYGKLIYTYNQVLEIVSRYDDGKLGRGPYYVLYRGPLL